MSQNDTGSSGKKPFGITIAGFTLGKKFFIVVGIIVLFIIVSTIIKNKKEQAEYEQAQRELEEAQAKNANTKSDVPEEYDYHAMMQAELTKQYGKAPDGFEWDYNGELLPLGDDKESNAEDVVFLYMRSLSTLDFATASRYAENSTVIESYKGYYETYGLNDYYSNFLRKQFKKSLTSLEVTGISDVAVFADGTKYVTVTANVLDLTDKDFWRKDEKQIYKTLEGYSTSEDDSLKVEQYIYDYIYSKYEDKTVGKRTVNIELVVDKKPEGGWLVSEDGELNAMLQYEKGVNIADYIRSSYDTWLREKQIEDQQKAVQKQIEEQKKQADSIKKENAKKKAQKKADKKVQLKKKAVKPEVIESDEGYIEGDPSDIEPHLPEEELDKIDG